MASPRAAAVALVLASAVCGQTTVFTTDFETGLPIEFTPGAATLTGVQGYAGLGPAGDQFGGSFLRSPTGNIVTLALTGLPPHNAISIDFLFAAIDSLDGTGTYPSGDFFKVSLDGNPIFRESFANATASQVQSYVPPPGVQLARHVDLGFSGPGGYYTDSAYWLGGDPAFQNLGHTASTATIEFVIEGPGIQSLADESWAIDNLTVSVDTANLPGSAVAYGPSCGPVFTANATPRIGQPLPLLLQNLHPATTRAGCEMGLSDASFGGLPLPLALDSYGLPGCFLLHDLTFGQLPITLSNGAAVANPLIPTDPLLLGLVVYLQCWTEVPGVNAANLTTSNALRVTIGQ